LLADVNILTPVWPTGITRGMNIATAASRALLPGLLVISCVLLWYYCSGGSWLLPSYWTPALRLDLQWWLGGTLGLAAVLQLLRPAQSRVLLLAAGALYLMQGIGWLPSLATLLFFLSCWCVGRCLLLLAFPASQTSNHTLPLLLGLALQLALFGALIHFPLNYTALYLVAQILPLSLLLQPTQREALLQPLVAWLDSSRNLLNRVPYIPCVLLLLVLGAVARYALFPTISGDDNAVHLRLWTELAWRHEYSFDVRSQIWAVAPFALDLVHAIISLAAGRDGRGALDFCLYALLLRQLWCILGYWALQPQYRLLLLALFASTPLVGNLLITLQTELFMALLAAAGVRFLLDTRSSWYSEQGLGLVAVAALVCATKLPGAVLGLLLLAPSLWQLWPLRVADWRQHSLCSRWVVAGFVLVCTWVALHSYLMAWGVTGNPLFPLYNGIFLSPYNDPVNFSDGRWMHGFSLASYWAVFFATSSHYESRDFVAGFQYLFLLPLGFVLLLRHLPWRQAWIIGLPLFGFGLVMFSSTQYWRYLLPVMPLAVLAMAPLLMDTVQQRRWQRAVACTAMLCCLGLNLWFYPGISYLMAIPPGQVYTPAGRDTATLEYLPEKAMSTHVSATAPGSTVLYQPERPFGAVLHGEPWYPMWYAPQRRDRAASVVSSAALEQALRDEGITHVVWNLQQVAIPSSGNDILRSWLSRYGLPLLESNGVVLSALSQPGLQYRPVWQDNSALGTQPQLLHELSAGTSKALRVSGRFTCSDPAATIVLNLAWNNGVHTWRFMHCAAQPLDYQEAIAVPAGAVTAGFSLFTQGSGTVAADNLTLELY
jgi:hypothetical protein